MSLFKSLAKSFVEALIESAQQTSNSSTAASEAASDSTNQDRRGRYVGDVHGAPGVVDVHVTRIQNQYQDVFRIEGTIATRVQKWRFQVDGYSGYGKLHDETVIYMEISEQRLSITINPYDQPAPTYHFRRA